MVNHISCFPNSENYELWGVAGVAFLLVVYFLFLIMGIQSNETKPWVKASSTLISVFSLSLSMVFLGGLSCMLETELPFSMIEQGSSRSLYFKLWVFSLLVIFFKGWVYANNLIPNKKLMTFLTLLSLTLMSVNAFLLGVELCSPSIVLALSVPFGIEEAVALAHETLPSGETFVNFPRPAAILREPAFTLEGFCLTVAAVALGGVLIYFLLEGVMNHSTTPSYVVSTPKSNPLLSYKAWSESFWSPVSWFNRKGVLTPPVPGTMEAWVEVGKASPMTEAYWLIRSVEESFSPSLIEASMQITQGWRGIVANNFEMAAHGFQRGGWHLEAVRTLLTPQLGFEPSQWPSLPLPSIYNYSEWASFIELCTQASQLGEQLEVVCNNTGQPFPYIEFP